MWQRCSESSCPYLGISLLQATRKGSARLSNNPGDSREVSRGHSTGDSLGKETPGRPEHQTRSETFVSLGWRGA